MNAHGPSSVAYIGGLWHSRPEARGSTTNIGELADVRMVYGIGIQTPIESNIFWPTFSQYLITAHANIFIISRGCYDCHVKYIGKYVRVDSSIRAVSIAVLNSCESSDHLPLMMCKE